MATSGTATIISHLRKMVMRVDGAGMTDGELLKEFVVRRDAAAFESLVRRHGPMVLGVCHRILRDPHDAEDAFQSTFLVLARKAASVSPREMVGNWLYGVARMTAIRLRAAKARRRGRERQVADVPEPEARQEDHQNDLLRLLDEELARLPDKFRVPIVLCDLEGRTRKEVARQLSIPEGTLSSRLTKARRMLAKRLARHGLAVSGGALAAALSESATSACLSVSLVNSTVKAAMLAAAGQTATGLISVQVVALTEGVLKAMFLTKMKTVMGVMLVIASLCGAAGLIYQTQAAEPRKTQQANEKADKDRQHAGKQKQDELRGEWELVSWDNHGERVSLAEMDKATKTCVFRGTDLTLPFMRGKGFVVKLDSAKQPKTIDLQPKDNPAKTFLGIYQVDDNTLKICFRDSELEQKVPQDRPLSFTLPTEDIQRLTLRRPKKPRPKDDPDALRGVWRVISVQPGNDEAEATRWERSRWLIQAESIDIRMKDGAAVGLAYKLDPSRSPKILDLKLFGRSIPALYALEGDILQIRMGLHATTRPKALSSEEGDNTMLLILQRERIQKTMTDKERLQGTWTIISKVDDGEKDESAVGDEWTFKDWVVRAKEKPKRRYGVFASSTFYLPFRLDETTNPKRIEMVEGTADDLFDTAAFEKRLDDADQRHEGIYAIARDMLKICISRKSGKRPTAFESKKGSNCVLLLLQKQNAKDKEKEPGREPKTEDETERGKTDDSVGYIPIKLGPKEYDALFQKTSGLLTEHFEHISYSNRYEGRIEAYKIGPDTSRSSVQQNPLQQHAFVRFETRDNGYLIAVRINKVRMGGTESEQAVGRNTDLERLILKKLNAQPVPKDLLPPQAPPARPRESKKED